MLKGSLDYGVVFQPSKLTLTGFSDADWASCLEGRKSTSGYCDYLGDNLVSWTSKNQGVVSHSTTEAECMSLANMVSEVTWFNSLLDEIGVKLPGPPVVWCDNSSTVSWAANPVLHARVKHVELDIHFVRDKVLSGALQVNHVPGKDQVADIFTRPLTIGNFARCRDKLNVVSLARVVQGKYQLILAVCS